MTEPEANKASVNLPASNEANQPASDVELVPVNLHSEVSMAIGPSVNLPVNLPSPRTNGSSTDSVTPPADPDGLEYSGDLFTVSGTPAPEQQTEPPVATSVTAEILPDVTGMPRRQAAYTYADAGIHVFPVDGKQPQLTDLDEHGEVWSKSWKEFSTTSHGKIDQWARARWAESGEHNPQRWGIGIDLGKSGMVALDVDRPDCVPAEWWPLLDAAPFESSDSGDERRGRYYFQQPEKTVGCPVAEWGEVKGMGGLVIVSPSPHASAHEEWRGKVTKAGKYRATARYQQIRTGTLPVLPEAIASTFGEHRNAQAAAAEADVTAFMKSHQGGADEDPTLVKNIVATFVREVTGPAPAGRHPSMVGKCAWAAHAAAAGLIDSFAAYQNLKNAFRQSLRVVGEERTEMPGEFDAMWAWGVGQVTEESLGAYLVRRAEKWKGKTSEELSRIARSMLGGVFDGQEAGNNVVEMTEPGRQAVAAAEAAVSAAAAGTPLVPDPIPLIAPDAEPYNMDQFGRMGHIAGAFADGLGVSPDMIIVGMLATASTACGGKAYVYVDERAWKQPVIFHGINLVPPGGMKSDSGKICWKPVLELQKERRDTSQAQAELDAMYLDICESRIEKLKKDAVRVANPADREQVEADLALEIKRRAELEDKRTTPCRLWANDTTPEALLENMARQGGRMAILDAEPRFLKIMAGGAGRKGGNPDPSIMLAGYDQDAGARDRITNRTEVILEKPSLTIGIFTQPKRFASIASDNIEMDEGGAWGRFFFSVPTGMRLRSRTITRVPEATASEHDARIRAMFREIYDNPDEVIMTLAPEAEELFLDHWLAKDPALLPSDLRVRIDGWDEKEEGRALRIATLIELYENPKSRVIGVDRIKDVIAISETMRTHARAASEYIATMEGNPLAPAREILEWLRETMPTGSVNAGKVLRGLRGKRSKTVARMDHVLDALKILEDYNWIRPALLDDRGRGDLRMFLPHPSLRGPGESSEVRLTPEAAALPADPGEAEVKGKAETLAEDVWTCVVSYCDSQQEDGSPPPDDWRVQADELYELFCETTEWQAVDGMTDKEKVAVPEDQRIDKIRFGTALKERFPSVGTDRKGRAKVLWYTGLRLKLDRS